MGAALLYIEYYGWSGQYTNREPRATHTCSYAVMPLTSFVGILQDMPSNGQCTLHGA